jgi:hypothetical protein
LPITEETQALLSASKSGVNNPLFGVGQAGTVYRTGYDPHTPEAKLANLVLHRLVLNALTMFLMSNALIGRKFYNTIWREFLSILFLILMKQLKLS